MASKLAKNITELETRRRAILAELESVEACLDAIAAAISNSSRGQAEPQAPRRARRAWFKPNEASQLLRSLAGTPKAPAQLVVELARCKRYAGQLSPQDKKRFEGAAYMAIAQAVRTGALKRARDGQVVAK